MTELKHFTCTMTAEITRVVEARDKEHALEIVDENDMVHELKNYKTDYEMSARELHGKYISYQHKMLIIHNIFAYLVDGRPIKVTREQYDLFKEVYDAMHTGVRLQVKELESEDKVIISLGRYK